MLRPTVMKISIRYTVIFYDNLVFTSIHRYKLWVSYGRPIVGLRTAAHTTTKIYIWVYKIQFLVVKRITHLLFLSIAISKHQKY